MNIPLKVARMRMGLSQKEVAERLGVHCQTVSAWEGGQRIPSGESMVRLARLLDTTVEKLFFTGAVNE